MRKETWKPVVGLEKDYAVSDMGRVQRLTGATNTFPGRILKPGKVGGYLYVVLKRKNYYVHHLVLTAFVGPRPEGQQCNHNNEKGDKTDNRWPESLEWVTPKRNMEHAVATGLHKGMKGKKHPFYGVFGKDHPLFGFKHSRATRKRMSEERKQRYLDPEARRKLSIAHFGRYHSAETRERMSRAQRLRHSKTKQRKEGL